MPKKVSEPSKADMPDYKGDEENKDNQNELIKSENIEPLTGFGNIDSNKLRTSLFELKKINIKKYPSKIKLYHTQTNFYNAIINSEIENSNNVVAVPSIWQYKNPSKRYLNNPKFYINKPPFELPELIAMTSIAEMRDSTKVKEDEEKIDELSKISQYRTSGTILNGVSLDYEKNHNLLIKMGSKTYNKKQKLLPFGKTFNESMDLKNLNSENEINYLLFENDIKVGKLSKNLMKVLGINMNDKNTKKSSFPYWCKIANFNNKVSGIVLNEGKGIIDSTTGQYCSLKKSVGETLSNNSLFGRKPV
ncbi:hypothetical protein QEN19_003661 [Hanseniaspora menglaensis]